MTREDKGPKKILIIEDQPIFYEPLKKRLEIEFGNAVSVKVAKNYSEAESLLLKEHYFLGIIDLALDPAMESKYFFPEDKTDFEGVIIEKEYSKNFQHYCFLTGTIQKLATEALGQIYQTKIFSKSKLPSFGGTPFPQNIIDYIRSSINEEKNGQ